MNKEMLDILNDLSKKPTTELALQIMELSSENLILEQQVKKQKEVIEKIKTRYIDYYGTTKEVNDDYVLRNVLKEISDLLKEVE